MLLAERPTPSHPEPFDIQRREHSRLVYTEACLIQSDERGFNARALNISEGGICVKLQSLGFVKRGTKVALLLQSFPPIDAKVRWVKDRVVGLQFMSPIEDHPRVLDLINRLSDGKPARVQPDEINPSKPSDDFTVLYDEIPER